MAGLTEQLSISNISGQISGTLTGVDFESGNSELNDLYSFPAASTNVPFTLALTAANLQCVILISSQAGTITTNGTGTADVQTISISGTPTGGYFSIDFNGQTTAVPYNVSASNLQTALQAISTIGSGNVTCSGGALPGTPIVCTFAGTLATGQQKLFNVYSGALTGGTSPTVSVAHTTPGLPSNTITLNAGVPLVWGASLGWGSNPFTANVSTAYFTCTLASQLKIRILSL
jgi:hypothetical protein